MRHREGALLTKPRGVHREWAQRRFVLSLVGLLDQGVNGALPTKPSGVHGEQYLRGCSLPSQHKGVTGTCTATWMPTAL